MTSPRPDSVPGPVPGKRRAGRERLVAACRALAAQVDRYQWHSHDDDGPLNLSEGQLARSPGDRWTVTRRVPLNGNDPLNVVPWMKLRAPVPGPAECTSPVTAPGAGRKPETAVLLFPALPGVRAALTQQIQADRASFTGGTVTLVENDGIPAWWTSTNAMARRPPYGADADILTTFTWGGQGYVVVWRDPVITDPTVTT